MTRDLLDRLFGFTLTTRADVVIWQCDCHDAPAMLDAWATVNGLTMMPRAVFTPDIGHDLAHDVTTPIGSRITVYVLSIR